MLIIPPELFSPDSLIFASYILYITVTQNGQDANAFNLDVRDVGSTNGTTLEVDNAPIINKGGIDFAQSNLNMQIKRDGVGVVLPVDQQDMENIKIDGLVPEILSIHPAVGSPLFRDIGITAP